MNNGHKQQKIECLACELPTQERLNYFTGQFLAQRDFVDEQAYLMGKHRQHNHYLHGYGTVCGLKVVQHPNPACRNRFVVIQPGLALDCCGREIFLRDEVYVDLDKALAPILSDPTTTGKHLLLSLCYTECKTEFVPALYSECGCDEMGCEANRIYEGAEVKVKLANELPKSPLGEASGGGLEWMTTLSMNDALRIAIDPKHERIYVLTSTDPGQIRVYDATHHCHLRDIPIDRRGVDLAVDSTGRFLYVIRYVATAVAGSGNYFLRVMRVKDDSHQDLSRPEVITTATSDDIPFSAGTSDNPPKLAVGTKDTSGKVFTLDPNTTSNQVVVWNSKITETGFDPSLPVTNSNSPKYYKGSATNPRAIAVSPDGSWLFIAETNVAVTHVVRAFKVKTLQQTSPTIHPIGSLDSEMPSLLAVSGDSQWLYIVTDAQKVRVFQIQDSPELFPEVGTTGVGIGAEAPVGIQVSASGKWAYVLLNKDPTTSNQGIIKVVNRLKFGTPTEAVSGAIQVVAAPRHLQIAADGQRLYAVGAGTQNPPACGGVSVLTVHQEQCKDLLWQALEGCPKCPEDRCVLLAVIRNYETAKPYENADIDNQIRPMVPSTETLRKLIWCALERGGGSGKDGEPGKDGAPGAGLEAGLTQIKALSWSHNEYGNQIVWITRRTDDNQQRVPVIVIEFTKKVRVRETIDSEHVFQVLVEQDPSLRQQGIVFRCPLIGEVIPVRITSRDNGRISGAEEITNSDLSSAAAFVLAPSVVEAKPEFWVRLRGDFVLDEKNRAIDAEFVRAELPTGNHPRALGESPPNERLGIQGGLFESWFWVTESQ